ncbi:hypothetical protein LCGC14_2084520 [marine sediment metagenome]|uniref:Phosphoadenosine phosphosulphate reductase domain-containing protein n=1 Tax=marine sediment metagenome TaxID=412755 RepID=A0A0F9HBM0_9ZZZZ
METDAVLNILSLGAGVQSTAMALMAAHGEIEPMPDAAIFADTGWEPQAVYEHLKFLMSPNVLPFPVYVVSKGNIRDDLTGRAPGKRKRFAAIPFFTEGGGLGRRQCTSEYKISPIRKKCREMLGLKPRQRAPKHVAVISWIGISTDEVTRMKPSREVWCENIWPLIDARMNRWDCRQWLHRHDYPDPPKSSCVGCPFHSNEHWRAMRDIVPTDWADAVKVDGLIRVNGSLGDMGERQFMHRSLVPLGEADLGDNLNQYAFDMECEGLCGV